MALPHCSSLSHTGAAQPPQSLDLGALHSDTAAMLLDGLAATSCGRLPPPQEQELLAWDGPGTLCQVAASRAADAAATACQAGMEAQFEEDFAAQQQQAEEDWAAEFDAAEAAANEGGPDEGAGNNDGLFAGPNGAEAALLDGAWQQAEEGLQQAAGGGLGGEQEAEGGNPWEEHQGPAWGPAF
jgi:hypothetical protein